MKQYDRGTLLFNRLWQVKSDVISKLNLDLIVSTNKDNGTVANINMKTVGEIMRDSVASLLSKTSNQIDNQDEENDSSKDNEKIALFRDNSAGLPSTPNKNDNSSNKLSSNNESVVDDWSKIFNDVVSCKKCVLCNSRQHVVLDGGNKNADWMFVGESPGKGEDHTGNVFVGASGELLGKMIVAMKLNINDVYLCYATKCMPPSRHPEVIEVETCSQYLMRQIELVKPKIIVAFGRFASLALLGVDAPIEKIRSNNNLNKTSHNIPVVATYSLDYLLRNIDAKKKTWVDLQLAMQLSSNFE